MIELSKGQVLPLTTDGGEPLGRIRLGVGWDKIPTAGFISSGAPEVDLDASAVQFAGEQLFDLAFYNNLATRDGSVVHQGDNQSGSGAGDDEAVEVDLARVYAKVDTIVFLVSSYQGHTLEWINNAYCRLLGEDGETELARFTLTGGVAETGVVLATLVRDGTSWTLHAVGEGVAVTKPSDAVNKLRRFVVGPS